MSKDLYLIFYWPLGWIIYFKLSYVLSCLMHYWLVLDRYSIPWYSYAYQMLKCNIAHTIRYLFYWSRKVLIDIYLYLLARKALMQPFTSAHLFHKSHIDYLWATISKSTKQQEHLIYFYYKPLGPVSVA